MLTIHAMAIMMSACIGINMEVGVLRRCEELFDRRISLKYFYNLEKSQDLNTLEINVFATRKYITDKKVQSREFMFNVALQWSIVPRYRID